MSAAPSAYAFQFGGSLDGNAPSYVTRQADSDYYQALKQGQFCYVLNSRQMGKSSLRVRAMQRLQQEGVVCIFIDLTGIGKQDVTAEKWYAGIVQSLVSGGSLNPKIPWRTWWQERKDLFSPAQRLALFIEEVLLVEVQQDIVIFVDEIDRVLSQTFSLDDFFGLIRFCFEQRAVEPRYRHLCFSLLGVATPRDLMRDPTQTPFNIGKSIDLKGFQLYEVQPLIQGLRGKVDRPEVVMQEILDWTGGQPFLTQKLCQLVASFWMTTPFPSVEQVVRARVLENWEFQDEPEHLRTIRDRILRSPQYIGRSLGQYQQILDQGEIASDSSAVQMELKLSGLVVDQEGKLRCYNRICKAIFHGDWVAQQLKALRPYGTAIAAWFDSGCQDESFLLQGQALQEALTWALGKSLSDRDYQFLVASQELGNRQALTSLAVTEQASQLLASARQTAKTSVLKQRLHWNWLPRIVLFVTAPVLLLRYCGLLQAFEWNLLDQFFRWRPLGVTDNRIAIVTIDESDITRIGQWPIPDRVLAKALTQIQAQKPQAIGLDLFRDFPVEPGNRELTQVFASTPNLFGIETMVGNRVSPPPLLKQRHQVGFADQVLDADGRVRRAQLTIALPGNDVNYSLASQLALNYLTQKGVTITPITSQQMRVGKAIFNRFQGNNGGYVRADSGGYQILLNYRGSQQQFLTYSIQQVLGNQIPPNAFRDRLVLVGTTAESLKDFFYTPYSSKWFGAPLPMAGIILHANIVSYLLSAALDGQAVIKTWSKPAEWAWIVVWAGVSAGLGWRSRSMGTITLLTLLTGGILVGLSYIAFLYGWWLPLVPAGLSLFGVAVVLPIMASRQRDRLLIQHTLAELLGKYSSYPIAVRIAVESLRQSEPKENQAFIEQQFKHQREHPSSHQGVDNGENEE